MRKDFGNIGNPIKPAEEGCYTNGLWIEGAQWSDEH
jgi:hypothetical protein